eukprot:m.62742 g.62742  ORF g.62742 m.62742 type:complete len:84 (+) comp49593_c0_seq2:159-410(+)
MSPVILTYTGVSAVLLWSRGARIEDEAATPMAVLCHVGQPPPVADKASRPCQHFFRQLKTWKSPQMKMRKVGCDVAARQLQFH